MITKVAFGHNTAVLLDLNELVLGYERGYVFRDFVAKMMDHRKHIHSTIKRCQWAPVTYDQNVSDNNKRTIIQLAGVHNILLNHATSKIIEQVKTSQNLLSGCIEMVWGAYVCSCQPHITTISGVLFPNILLILICTKETRMGCTKRGLYFRILFITK